MSDGDNTFGSKLRALRIQKNMSQGEMAKEITDYSGGQLRLSQAKVSTLEQLETAPRQDVLEIFAGYFDVPVVYFFETASKDESVRARAYLEQLVRRKFARNEILAHSTDLRTDDDEISRTLKTKVEAWQPHYDDDEYLDT